MIISLKLNPQDEIYLKNLAAKKNIKISEYIRQAVLEHIDYETDFQSCSRRTNITETSSKQPVIYSLDKNGALITI